MQGVGGSSLPATTTLIDDFSAYRDESRDDQRRQLNSDKTLVKISPLPGSLNASQSLLGHTPRKHSKQS